MLPIAVLAFGCLRRLSEAARARRGDPAVRSAAESAVRLGAFVRNVSSDVATLVYRVLGLPLALARAVLGRRLQLPLAPGTARAAAFNLGPYRLTFAVERRRRPEASCGSPEERPRARHPRPRPSRPRALADPPAEETSVASGPSTPLRALRALAEYSRLPGSSARAPAVPAAPPASGAHRRAPGDLAGVAALGAMGSLPSGAPKGASRSSAKAGSKATSPPKAAPRHAKHRSAAAARREAPAGASGAAAPTAPLAPSAPGAARAASDEDREFLAAAKSFAAVGVAEETSATIKAGRDFE